VCGYDFHFWWCDTANQPLLFCLKFLAKPLHELKVDNPENHWVFNDTFLLIPNKGISPSPVPSRFVSQFVFSFYIQQWIIQDDLCTGQKWVDIYWGETNLNAHYTQLVGETNYSNLLLSIIKVLLYQSNNVLTWGCSCTSTAIVCHAGQQKTLERDSFSDLQCKASQTMQKWLG